MYKTLEQIKADKLKLIARATLMHSKKEISDERLAELLSKIKPIN